MQERPKLSVSIDRTTPIQLASQAKKVPPIPLNKTEVFKKEEERQTTQIQLSFNKTDRPS